MGDTTIHNVRDKQVLKQARLKRSETVCNENQNLFDILSLEHLMFMFHTLYMKEA